MKKVEKTTPSVNVHNDVEMVNLGIRVKPLIPRDPKIWSKTYSEKKDAKLVKHHLKHAFDGSRWPAPSKSIPVVDKLIITITPDELFTDVNKKGKRVMKTTYTHICNQHDIPAILSKYSKIVNKKNVSLVIKYYWNGKTYTPGVLPFWK